MHPLGAVWALDADGVVVLILIVAVHYGDRHLVVAELNISTVSRVCF